MKKLWSLEESSNLEENNPVEFIYDCAHQVAIDTNGLIEGIIVESTSEVAPEVIYGFYLSSKQLRHYSYRLFQIVMKSVVNPYPIKCIQYAKVEENNQHFECNDYNDFVQNLTFHIENPITKLILQSIKVHIDIVGKYNGG